MNRFKFEEAITKLWQTSEDIKLLCDNLPEGVKHEISNTLTGIAELNDLRVQRVWEIFEYLITNGIITSEEVANKNVF